jgi:hypothetical protein
MDEEEYKELTRWILGDVKRQLRTDRERFSDPRFRCVWPDAANDISKTLARLRVYEQYSKGKNHGKKTKNAG